MWLQDHIGLPQALASQRLQTDGAEVLWDFGRHSGDPADQDMVEGLVVVRSGDVLLGKDLAIAHSPLEAQVVYMTGARVFALSNANLTGPTMAQWQADNEAKIVAAALEANGPYVMSVNLSYGLRRVKLACPLG